MSQYSGDQIKPQDPKERVKKYTKVPLLQPFVIYKGLEGSYTIQSDATGKQFQFQKNAKITVWEVADLEWFYRGRRSGDFEVFFEKRVLTDTSLPHLEEARLAAVEWGNKVGLIRPEVEKVEKSKKEEPKKEDKPKK